MKIKLIESSGHSYNSVRKRVEKMISSLSSDGFDFNLSRSLDKNKFETHYYGKYNGEPFTLMANTTHRALDDGPEDVFFTLLYKGKLIPLGPADSKDKNALYELLDIYFGEEKRKKEQELAMEQARKDEIAKREEQEKKARLISQQAEDEERAKEEASELEDLSNEYKELTGKELPNDISLSDAQIKITQAKYLKQIPSIISGLDNLGYNSNLTISFKNDDSSLSGHLEVVKLGLNQYLLNDKRSKASVKDEVISKDTLTKVLSDPITADGSVPNLLSIRDRDDNVVTSEFYG